MAEALGIAASIIAVVQITDRVIHLCKFWLGSLKDAPADIRIILLEVSTLRTILDTIHFVSDTGTGPVLTCLSGKNGPIEACKEAVAGLESLLPSDHVTQANGTGKKRARLRLRLQLVLSRGH
jgi:hypothetical protein